MITRSGLLHQAWVRSQLPVNSPLAGTVDDYLEHELYREGISPNPLLEPAYCPPDDGRLGEPITAYLTGQMQHAHPLFDGDLYQHLHPAALDHPGRAAGHFLANVDDSTRLPTRWLSEDERLTWREFQATIKAAPVKTRPEPATVIVILRSAGPSVAASHSALCFSKASRTSENPTTHAFAVATNQSEQRVFRSLSRVAPHLRVLSSSDEFVGHNSSYIAIADRGCQFQTGWPSGCVETLEKTQANAATPLVVSWDGLILDHGLIASSSDALPFAAQRGLPSVDALPDGSPVSALGLSAAVVTSALLDSSRTDAAELFSLSSSRLSSRLSASTDFTPVASAAVALVSESLPGSRGSVPAVVADSDAVALRSATAGHKVTPPPESVTGIATTSTQPAIEIDGAWQLPAAVFSRTSRDKLRWAVRVAAPSGRIGDRWGDVAFAHDLVEALTEAGQVAFVERIDNDDRQGRQLDDVCLVLRGLEAIEPCPSATNVLWVISHPDLVTEPEIRNFDVVFAASQQWAEQRTRTGTKVETLLQATNPRRFHMGPERAASDIVLFVGSSRRQLRPIVRDAIETGSNLAVYGTGWNALIDPRYIVSDYVEPEEVGELYRGAAVVLSDQWDDMAAGGFIVNRIFDALAAGADVISVPVVGLADVFGERVRTYRTLDELKEGLAMGTGRDHAQRTADSLWVTQNHSFANRVDSLISRVADQKS